MAKGYAFKQALDITGASRSELTWWADQGVVTASVQEAGGPGRHRRFAFCDLVEICVAKELNALRIPGPMIKKALNALRDMQDDIVRTKVAANWRRYRNPKTRPAGWRAKYDLAILEQAPGFQGLFAIGDPADFVPPHPVPSVLLTFTIHLDNLLFKLEKATGGDWWEPSDRERARDSDDALMARLATELSTAPPKSKTKRKAPKPKRTRR